MIERLPELTSAYRVVDELSELQLPTLSRGTTVAVYTNVTVDHLDRHGSPEAYRLVKRRLAELVDPAGALVLNVDDLESAGYAELGQTRTVLYRRGQPTAGWANVSSGGGGPPGSDGGQLGVVDGWIVAAGLQRLGLVGGGPAETGPGGRIMPVAELAIPGAHNVSNALAAIAVALLFGLPPDAIRREAAAFQGVEHRLEPVALIDGVRFINDSQGTQPDAVAAALRAFDPPIVLIAGGRSKGLDLGALAPIVAERVVAAVLIGESGPDLEAAFRAAGLARTEQAANLDQAVRRADAIAREVLARGASGVHRDAPAIVLLSPAAASFDMFADYAARGRAFRAAVAAIGAERRGGVK
jgi:UDP-N-acetylmuramoylalanine--D-glutamate ligase